MLETIRIQNFKSIVDLKLELGRVNVLIGENGSGKSNLLEALAFASVAIGNRFKTKELVDRGVRDVDVEKMRPLFNFEESIETSFKFGNEEEYHFSFFPPKESSFEWMVGRGRDKSDFRKVYDELLSHLEFPLDKYSEEEQAELLKKWVLPVMKQERKEFDDCVSPLKDFHIYSPEESALRNFYKEGQTKPFSVKGHGLFNHLQELSNAEKTEQLVEIKETLELLGWFDSLEIPETSSFGEKKLNITDHYLKENIFLDHKSVNEGFLFILFYATLLVSDATPKFFAIDNIDASLNPKLCAKLMERIAHLAKKYNKQIICTTHNPAVLDGLDITQDDQRLFVVSRRRDGSTRVRRVLAEEVEAGNLRLSERFIRGYLGGLPRAF